MNRVFAVFFIILLMFSCAKIVTPSGGAKDNQPPTFVSSKPYLNAINFNGREIEIEFNEYIVLENPINKVLISPQIQPAPEIVSNLKSIYIKGLDSLKENTTYIIDFADAIKDYNEGNRLNGFSFAFSTGNHIDTLWYEGVVLDAFELKPIANKYVLLYSFADTTYIRTNPSDYLTKTDSNGVFRFHNLAPKQYKVIILDDKNQNKIYDLPNEGIGFSNTLVEPYLADSTVNTRLLKQRFYYTDFVEEKVNENTSVLPKHANDTIFKILKPQKDTVPYYNGNYQLTIKDSLLTNEFEALLVYQTDTNKVIFQKTNDSIYTLATPLHTANKYEIIINKSTITNIHQQSNAEYRHKFYYSSPEDYGTLFININGEENTCKILYLYDIAGKLIQEKSLSSQESKARFDNLLEGVYKLKISIDENCNNIWDKANFSSQIEAEKVLNFNKILQVKKSWEIEEEWNLSE